MNFYEQIDTIVQYSSNQIYDILGKNLTTSNIAVLL